MMDAGWAHQCFGLLAPHDRYVGLRLSLLDYDKDCELRAIWFQQQAESYGGQRAKTQWFWGVFLLKLKNVSCEYDRLNG